VPSAIAQISHVPISWYHKIPSGYQKNSNTQLIYINLVLKFYCKIK
jgi:hypothetical protein